ncbi:hypothetical protein IWW36_000418 [Coemansia brasiliensis]|uniref:PSP proline-rich domain-containing protein n=1 Tax=Coemansia brasiliensis TaxID=2650707 RepID=A0A9W8IAX5_9FUNG|nr:hypothetical protein IWW36_000418 [Coemansia brasiliensis]
MYTAIRASSKFLRPPSNDDLKHQLFALYQTFTDFKSKKLRIQDISVKASALVHAFSDNDFPENNNLLQAETTAAHTSESYVLISDSDDDLMESDSATLVREPEDGFDSLDSTFVGPDERSWTVNDFPNCSIPATSGFQLENHPSQQVPNDVVVEYVEQEEPQVENTPFEEYSKIFSQFASKAAKSFGIDPDAEEDSTAVDKKLIDKTESKPGEGFSSDEDTDMNESDDDMDVDSTENKPSRKQKKKNRMSVAELKQIAPRPELVEWTDTSARDPELLVALKAVPNTVPVPIHWSQKKKYLQYKRGIEKPPFELPNFIKATGIMEMREAIQEKEDEKQAKTTARERMRPKMNKLTLDYQRLHDAFFKLQTPPKNLTGHGDLFYEGKEMDVSYNFTPGILSESLQAALSIPPLAPPPWLINMQRYGPPPSYPSLVIPGLNAPIPAGAQWGYHPGGWGRPPVDEVGRPLYGDVFSASTETAEALQAASIMNSGPKKYWGDLEVVESSDEEEEEEDEEESEEEIEGGAEPTVPASSAAETQGAAELTDEQLRAGMASIPSGLETPSVIQLRKQTAAGESTENKSLYTILSERETTQLEGIMGSQFTYDMSAAMNPSKSSADSGKNQKSQSSGRDQLDESQGNELCAVINEKNNVSAVYIRADVRKSEDLPRILLEGARKCGQIHILVNIAGIALYKDYYKDEDKADIDAAFDINIKAPMELTRLFVKELQDYGREGVVVNLASYAGFVPGRYFEVYGVTKAALIYFTKASQYLAPQIRVTAVAPFFVESPMVDKSQRVKKLSFINQHTKLSVSDVAHAVVKQIKTPSSAGKTVMLIGGISWVPMWIYEPMLIYITLVIYISWFIGMLKSLVTSQRKGM